MSPGAHAEAGVVPDHDGGGVGLLLPQGPGVARDGEQVGGHGAVYTSVLRLAVFVHVTQNVEVVRVINP